MTSQRECGRKPTKPATDNGGQGAFDSHRPHVFVSFVGSPHREFAQSMGRCSRNGAANQGTMEINYSLAQGAAECLLLQVKRTLIGGDATSVPGPEADIDGVI